VLVIRLTLRSFEEKGRQLKADEVRFSSLQYVKLKPVAREAHGDTESLTVEIDNYVLRLQMRSTGRSQSPKAAKSRQQGPMALIEYWSVDRTTTVNSSALFGRTIAAYRK